MFNPIHNTEDVVKFFRMVADHLEKGEAGFVGLRTTVNIDRHIYLESKLDEIMNEYVLDFSLSVKETTVKTLRDAFFNE